MRALFIACLIGLSICGCDTGADRFSLSAKLVQPGKTGAPLRLAIELRNDSDQTQHLFALTNLFEGRVHLRTTNGETHEFLQTNYMNMLHTASWTAPTIELAPGDSYRWEHALPEFVHHRRFLTESDRIGYPMLSTEFQPGCEIWCAFEVRQKKMLDDGRWTDKTTATVVSATVRHPE